MTRDEVIEFARREKWYKESMIERRMRPSESPNVKTIYRDGYIVAYEWIDPLPYRAEEPSEKKLRELREKEERLLCLARQGKLIF